MRSIKPYCCPALVCVIGVGVFTFPAPSARAQTAPDSAPAAPDATPPDGRPSPPPASDAPPVAAPAEQPESPNVRPNDEPSVDAPTGSPSASSTPAPDAVTGSVVVILFSVAGPPLGAGITVSTDDGSHAVTTEDGVARFSAPVGLHELFAVIPGEHLTPASPGPVRRSLGQVNISEALSTQVIVNVAGDGRIASTEVEGQTAEQADAEAEQQRAAAEAVVEYGVIAGQVVSAEAGTPVSGARVLVRGFDTERVTDDDGRFQLRVPVGTRSVSVIHTKYSLQTVDDVEVEKGGEVRLSIDLTPAATQLDDVVITAPHIQGGVASVISERRKSTTVQDALGSEDIAKSPDGSASSATRRIVGASIVGGAFLFVRGLGGRYSNVRLNGVPMPSTDPDLPGFQLDLFPTSVLSSLTISKTFSPDIPGDFAGGSLNVETRSFPDDFLLKVSLSTSYNSVTTFQDMLTYDGGDTDFLGFDDGTRAKPDGLPEQYIRTRSRSNPDGFTPGDIEAFGALLPNNWAQSTKTALPNTSAGLSIGDTIETSAGDVGYYLTLGYRNRYQRLVERVTNVTAVGRGEERRLQETQTLTREIGSADVQIGTLGTVSYAPTEEHSFSAVTMLTQNGSDEARLITGVDEEEGEPIQQRQYQWVERQLVFNQLLGKHQGLGDILDVAWQLNTARTQRDQPDTRNVLYSQQSGEFRFRGVTGSGEHLYTQLAQEDYGGGLDLRFSLFEDASAKAGYMGRTGDRRFRARRFGVNVGSDVAAQLLPPEQFFEPERSGEAWTVTEVTLPNDGYDATQTLHASYAMLELPLFGSLKFAGGLRLEHFQQDIIARTPYATSGNQSSEPEGTDRTDLDYLPGATLIYALSEAMSLRSAYGGTVARPQIRELSPFLNQDYVRRRTIRGNPDLERTFIHNFDLRWELFPTPTEVFAVSVFYKLFEDPIESVIYDQNGNITYENIQGANNYGAEFEARVGLGLLSDHLDSFSAMANFALIRSEVQLSEDERALATSARRPLAGQSPYVANLALGYEPQNTGISTFLYYNVFGRRIQDVGRVGLPDIYEEPFHALDWTLFYEPNEHWQFGFTASNILLQPVRVTQGGFNFSRAEPGLNLGLSAGWTY